jgi:enoyl-CoA hydratase/carnithine racemase
MTELVVVETSHRIATIRMNRPEKKNAISLEMYQAMTAALTVAANDGNVRVIVITGHASCFSSGNDVTDFVKAGSSGGVGLDAPLHFLRALVGLDKPVVAAVRGPAIGIGTTMLLHCDFVYAAPDAKFKTPFVDLALVPEAASSLVLPALVGHRRAAQLLQLGEEISAATAAHWGMITAVDDNPEQIARTTAERLATRAPSALQGTKALSHRSDRAAILETITVEGELFLARLKSPEAMEAFSAFMMRRQPDFSKF